MRLTVGACSGGLSGGLAIMGGRTCSSINARCGALRLALTVASRGLSMGGVFVGPGAGGLRLGLTVTSRRLGVGGAFDHSGTGGLWPGPTLGPCGLGWVSTFAGSAFA